ncbi:MAG: tyrosine-type recombinase/integrase [Chloroflexota bacterium]
MPGTQTLSELLERWLSLGNETWKPTTQHDYRAFAELIRQKLDNPPLSTLTPLQLQRFYLSLKGTPRKALYAHQASHRALKVGVMWGWIPVNPADKVMRPTYRKGPKSLWTAEECRRFSELMRDEDWWPLFVVALHTRCRYGELAGLVWEDVDAERLTIRIERTLQRIDKKWIVDSPKTQSGRRTVHIDESVLAALRKQRAL